MTKIKLKNKNMIAKAILLFGSLVLITLYIIEYSLLNNAVIPNNSILKSLNFFGEHGQIVLAVICLIYLIIPFSVKRGFGARVGAFLLAALAIMIFIACCYNGVEAKGEIFTSIAGENKGTILNQLLLLILAFGSILGLILE